MSGKRTKRMKHDGGDGAATVVPVKPHVAEPAWDLHHALSTGATKRRPPVLEPVDGVLMSYKALCDSLERIFKAHADLQARYTKAWRDNEAGPGSALNVLNAVHDAIAGQLDGYKEDIAVLKQSVSGHELREHRFGEESSRLNEELRQLREQLHEAQQARTSVQQTPDMQRALDEARGRALGAEQKLAQCEQELEARQTGIDTLKAELSQARRNAGGQGGQDGGTLASVQANLTQIAEHLSGAIADEDEDEGNGGNSAAAQSAGLVRVAKEVAEEMTRLREELQQARGQGGDGGVVPGNIRRHLIDAIAALDASVDTSQLGTDPVRLAQAVQKVSARVVTVSNKQATALEVLRNTVNQGSGDAQVAVDQAARIAVLAAENTDLKRQLEEVRANGGGGAGDDDDCQAQLRRCGAELARLRATHADEVTKLRQKVEDCKAAIKRVQQKNIREYRNRHSASAANQGGVNDQAGGPEDRRSQQHRRASDQLLEAKSRIARLQTEMRDKLNSKDSAHNQEKQRKVDEITTLRAKIGAKDAEIITLKNEVATLKAQARSAGPSGQSGVSVESLRMQLASAERRNAAIEEVSTNAQFAVTELYDITVRALRGGDVRDDLLRLRGELHQRRHGDDDDIAMLDALPYLHSRLSIAASRMRRLDPLYINDGNQPPAAAAADDLYGELAQLVASVDITLTEGLTRAEFARLMRNGDSVNTAADKISRDLDAERRRIDERLRYVFAQLEDVHAKTVPLTKYQDAEKKVAALLVGNQMLVTAMAQFTGDHSQYEVAQLVGYGLNDPISAYKPYAYDFAEGAQLFIANFIANGTSLAASVPRQDRPQRIDHDALKKALSSVFRSEEALLEELQERTAGNEQMDAVGVMGQLLSQRNHGTEEVCKIVYAVLLKQLQSLPKGGVLDYDELSNLLTTPAILDSSAAVRDFVTRAQVYSLVHLADGLQFTGTDSGDAMQKTLRTGSTRLVSNNNKVLKEIDKAVVDLRDMVQKRVVDPVTKAMTAMVMSYRADVLDRVVSQDGAEIREVIRNTVVPTVQGLVGADNNARQMLDSSTDLLVNRVAPQFARALRQALLDRNEPLSLLDQYRSIIEFNFGADTNMTSQVQRLRSDLYKCKEARTKLEETRKQLELAKSAIMAYYNQLDRLNLSSGKPLVFEDKQVPQWIKNMTSYVVSLMKRLAKLQKDVGSTGSGARRKVQSTVADLAKLATMVNSENESFNELLRGGSVADARRPDLMGLATRADVLSGQGRARMSKLLLGVSEPRHRRTREARGDSKQMRAREVAYKRGERTLGLLASILRMARTGAGGVTVLLDGNAMDHLLKGPAPPTASTNTRQARGGRRRRDSPGASSSTPSGKPPSSKRHRMQQSRESSSFPGSSSSSSPSSSFSSSRDREANPPSLLRHNTPSDEDAEANSPSLLDFMPDFERDHGNNADDGSAAAPGRGGAVERNPFTTTTGRAKTRDPFNQVFLGDSDSDSADEDMEAQERSDVNEAYELSKRYTIELGQRATFLDGLSFFTTDAGFAAINNAWSYVRSVPAFQGAELVDLIYSEVLAPHFAELVAVSYLQNKMQSVVATARRIQMDSINQRFLGTSNVFTRRTMRVAHPPADYPSTRVKCWVIQ